MMERILWVVGEFLEAGEGPRVVLFDGLLTVVSRNGFQPALKLVQSLRDMASARGAVLLLSADLRALSAEEGAQLQQGMRVAGGAT